MDFIGWCHTADKHPGRTNMNYYKIHNWAQLWPPGDGRLNRDHKTDSLQDSLVCMLKQKVITSHK